MSEPQKCYADDIGGTWNCVYYGINKKGNPCLAPSDYECEYKKEPEKVKVSEHAQRLSERMKRELSGPRHSVEQLLDARKVIPEVEALESQLDILTAALDKVDTAGLEAERDLLKEQLERYRLAIIEWNEKHIKTLKRAEAAEALIKKLQFDNSILEELNHGLDFCAEESDRRARDAEAEVEALRESNENAKDTIHQLGCQVQDLSDRLAAAQGRLMVAEEIMGDLFPRN